MINLKAVAESERDEAVDATRKQKRTILKQTQNIEELNEEIANLKKKLSDALGEFEDYKVEMEERIEGMVPKGTLDVDAEALREMEAKLRAEIAGKEAKIVDLEG